MKLKIVIGGIIIIAAVVFGALSFVESNVEYMNFDRAISVKKKVQVKGVWIKKKESAFNANTRQFTFYMKDDSGIEQKVIFSGARPNNFEIADAIVVKGKYENGTFHASEILTKCPSKYESKPTDGKTSM
ncbi:MAG: cytochrome c maturation protein CcmE [Ignavibacteriales bacterium]|nr:cytochrome c maturation protein CcmE [Ignavibacteriales bacterium]